MPAYADYDDLVARFDARTIADSLGDGGKPDDDPANSATLGVLLSEATGILDSAIRVGNMYTDDQITTLLAQDDTATEYLKGIVCRICWVLLLMRRPEKYKAAAKELEDLNKQVLDPIRQGARILGIENRDPNASQIQGDELNVSDIRASRPITSRTARYYPSREAQLPQSRGA